MLDDELVSTTTPREASADPADTADRADAPETADSGETPGDKPAPKKRARKSA